MPVVVPMLLWDESFINAVIANIFRFVYGLHCGFLVNSVAHMHGLRPYDKVIDPRESRFVTYFSLGEGYHNFHHTPYDKVIDPRESRFVTYFSLGEGYHNFHHTFPYDSNASEYDWRYNMNIPGFLLDILEKLNLVHDRKYAPKSYVQKKKDMASCNEQNNMESISKNYLDTLVGT
ncbi:unnamed protein product, partial [Oppiella nova]